MWTWLATRGTRNFGDLRSHRAIDGVDFEEMSDLSGLHASIRHASGQLYILTGLPISIWLRFKC